MARSNLPEPTPVDRKVVLSRLLAVAEAERCGLEPDPEEIRATARWWRREYGLLELESFAAWLQFSGLDITAFWAVMRDFTALTKVLVHNAERVDARMHDHLAIHSVHAFVGARR